MRIVLWRNSIIFNFHSDVTSDHQLEKHHRTTNKCHSISQRSKQYCCEKIDIKCPIMQDHKNISWHMSYTKAKEGGKSIKETIYKTSISIMPQPIRWKNEQH